jgi:hypothetical protein
VRESLVADATERRVGLERAGRRRARVFRRSG